MIKLNMDVKLEIEYDEVNGTFNVMSCIPIITNNSSALNSNFEHTLTETQTRYGILTLGSKFGNYMPRGQEVEIEVNGVKYKDTVVTHKTIKGRIDGLTKFYKEFSDLKEGTALDIIYDAESKTLKIRII